jgi:heat shock protein HspQ
LRRLQIGEFITVSCTQRSIRRLVRVACRPVRSNTFVMEIENQAAHAIVQPPMRKAKFAIGQVVKHRIYPFRGVIFDVDPVFANTEEWLASIPEEVRPRRDQPFYHLLAENAQTTYVAYVSEQNLLPDETGKPVSHPQVPQFFKELKRGQYVSRDRAMH